MTLVSTVLAADAQPDTARCGVLRADASGIAINDDVIMEVSRDGGTTWSAATLVHVQELTVSGNTYLEDPEIDLTGQPAGASMADRIVTEGGHGGLAVSGVLLQWNEE